MTRQGERAAFFRYIDRVRRAKLDIGYRSIHIRKAARKRRVPERDALPSQILLMISTDGMSLRPARLGSGQYMPIEHASVRVVHKPWGVGDLQPWSSIDGTGDAVGELWFERADKDAPAHCRDHARA